MPFALDMVVEMLNTLQANSIGTQTVTFPARALFVAQSEATLTYLLDNSLEMNGTLTIWGTDDIQDVNSLRQAIDSMGRHRIYLDVPEDLANEIGK